MKQAILNLWWENGNLSMINQMQIMLKENKYSTEI